MENNYVKPRRLSKQNIQTKQKPLYKENISTPFKPYQAVCNKWSMNNAQTFSHSQSKY